MLSLQENMHLQNTKQERTRQGQRESSKNNVTHDNEEGIFKKLCNPWQWRRNLQKNNVTHDNEEGLFKRSCSLDNEEGIFRNNATHIHDNKCNTLWAPPLLLSSSKTSLVNNHIHTPSIAFQLLLQILPELVTPRKRHSSSLHSCPPMWSASSKRFGY